MLDLHCYQTAYIVIVIINYKYYGSQCQYHIIFSLITQRLGGGLGGNNCIRFIILATSLSSKYENIALFILKYRTTTISRTKMLARNGVLETAITVTVLRCTELISALKKFA